MTILRLFLIFIFFSFRLPLHLFVSQFTRKQIHHRTKFFDRRIPLEITKNIELDRSVKISCDFARFRFNLFYPLVKGIVKCIALLFFNLFGHLIFRCTYVISTIHLHYLSRIKWSDPFITITIS